MSNRFVGTALSAAAILLGASGAFALDTPITAANGMVAAGHPLAVESGVKALRAGGTACDAAVAASATLSVVMTDMMGPLGSGYAVLWDAEAEELSAIDYNGVAPLATDPELFSMEGKRRGILAPTVPGNLKGWEEVHNDCGVLPWEDLWEDAIDYAEGRPLDEDSAGHINRYIPELVIYETWLDEFIGDGDSVQPGQMHSRPDLAETYRQFAAEGSDALYAGSVGEQLVEFMENEGGLITQEDLDAYEVVWHEPIHSTYRGLDIYGAQPSSSAITWMQILKILEGYDIAEMDHNSADYVHLFAEASKHAYFDSYRYNGDPAFVDVPVEQLLSDEYAEEVREKISDDSVWQLRPETSVEARTDVESTSTSHMSIIDQWGNAVSMTNTLGTFFGAGPVVEGTGLLMSNGMDWFDIDVNIWTGEEPGPLGMEPGKRNRWTLSPALIFDGDELRFLAGGAGAESTMWGIAQPLVNMIDFDMNVQEALDAPRFIYGDIAHYTGGVYVQLEDAFSDEVRSALADLGHDVVERGETRNSARGTTTIVYVDPDSGAYWGGNAPDGRDFVSGY